MGREEGRKERLYGGLGIREGWRGRGGRLEAWVVVVLRTEGRERGKEGREVKVSLAFKDETSSEAERRRSGRF